MIRQEKPNEGHPKGPIFVPKTFGFGWNLNFARWESFVILAIILLLVAAGWYFKKDEVIKP